jgi:hypothetical protein
MSALPMSALQGGLPHLWAPVGPGHPPPLLPAAHAAVLVGVVHRASDDF